MRQRRHSHLYSIAVPRAERSCADRRRSGDLKVSQEAWRTLQREDESQAAKDHGQRQWQPGFYPAGRKVRDGHSLPVKTPVRPNQSVSGLRVGQGPAEVLVSDRGGQDTQGPTAARMPSVGAQIRGSERCQERRRRLLEPIAEEPTGTTEETTPSDNSNDGQNDSNIDPFICTPCDDSEPARRTADVYQPTAAEYEAHRHDHHPYRNWCPFCVKARATGQRHGHACPHRRIPVIGIDYCFLTSDGRVLRNDELAGLDEATRQSLAKILLIREHSPNGQTGCIFAHVVPQKGVDEDMFSVTKVSEDVKWMGHTHIILKGDNEPALKKLIAESLKTLRVSMEQATDEKSIAYDPQSNGGTEIGVRHFKDQFRTLKLCLEDRLGKALQVDHPATAWLV